MDAMILETQLGSDSQSSDSRDVDGSASMHATAIQKGLNAENTKDQVTRESVFKRLTFSNVVGGEKAGKRPLFSWRGD
ncbi:hypothetical protein L6452_35001 [Arctium lappa]|uniref:Uncharacterized protein n=1 Tax=Arctium lappa TaxID=4217 RepID=A0ACB8YKT5_ARCLA|nr:hypothetical protein L6452_35001 [Arctium lappa]